MAQDNPNRRVSTNQAAPAPITRRSKLYTGALHTQPIQNPRDIPGRNEGPLPRSTASNQDLNHTQPPRKGVRGDIPQSPNHRNHRRFQRVDNSNPPRRAHRNFPRRPRHVRHWKNTAPWRLKKVSNVTYVCCHCGNGEDVSDTFRDTSVKVRRHKYEMYEGIREMFEGYANVPETTVVIHGIVCDLPAGFYQPAPRMIYNGIRRTEYNPERECAACPVIREEEWEKVLAPGKKGGKRSHDRGPRSKYVMPAATE
ncbi:uncharacterized protein J4E88_002435 [Alternaria novae-zelandiae]|uniref:uncharacterized protein n=1 Tax=Alternaria novae-zelandiae TaxID=430562 RepID=UPI0020C31E81|nr:uncharacterized protein J4E88_002435 [Alternaria novae-zelandiae]KAI4690962.1 hypothetical protein J4E88_002435 [Alternaria novae-zelandiae]